MLHKNAITTFMNMIRCKGSIDNVLALRQIVLKDENDKSWFMYVRKILGLYNLSSIFELYNNHPSKTEWKRIMNNAVNNTIEANLDMDIKKKTSLKYINKDSLKVRKCHHVWSTVRNSIYDSMRAQLKCSC